MKKIVFVSVSMLLISFSGIAQTNKIESTGNVGIGTTNPQEKLEVTGPIRITKDINSWRLVTNTDASFSIKETGFNGALNIFKSGNSNVNTLNINNGNVGIGTTNPETPLHIKQTTRHKGLTISENDNSLKIKLHLAKFDNGTEYGFFDLGGNTKLRGNGQNSIFDGKVGIGTTNPTDKLSVNGYTRIIDPTDENRFMLLHGNGHGNKIRSYGGPLLLETRLDSQNIEFKTNNSVTPLMIIKGSGDVGIGTTDTKGFKLGVKGKIAAEEVKVALYSTWPDFVFENNYELPSLQEVENHITKKGHLENIPSAAEVAENGIQLGEMNAKLLQKIEELTLYMIEQNKKTENLIKEVAILKQKNTELEKKIIR